MTMVKGLASGRDRGAAHPPDQATGTARRPSVDALRFRQSISTAFQPIVDVPRRTIFAQEALVRGAGGESAASVLGAVAERDRHAFDLCCQVTAVETAARLGVPGMISINLMPNAVSEVGYCLENIVTTAERAGVPASRLMFEMTESERIGDCALLRRIFAEYRRLGFSTAIDDFGAGFAGLQMLADLQPDLPDILKIDMGLIRGVDTDRARHTIVGGICETARKLGLRVIGEGIETEGERDALLEMGIALQQGFLFARPVFEGWIAPEALDGLPA